MNWSGGLEGQGILGKQGGKQLGWDERLRRKGHVLQWWSCVGSQVLGY